MSQHTEIKNAIVGVGHLMNSKPSNTPQDCIDERMKRVRLQAEIKDLKKENSEPKEKLANLT
jgi:hypothetical protein